MTNLAIPLLTLLLCPAPTTPATNAQSVDPRLAVSYQGGGVTWEDFYTEIARRYRGRDFAKSGLSNLIQARIVAIESKKRGLEADKLAVAARIQHVRQKLASANRTLEDHLRERNMTLEGFQELVELSLNTENLVRKDLGLDPKAPLENHKIALWMSEKKKALGVVTDPTKLPHDVCARIEDREIPLHEMGESMARILVAEDKKRILREMAAYRLLQARAKELKIEITQADFDEQLTIRRKEMESRPQFAKQGLKLEDLLRAQGRTLEDFTRGEVFRTNLLVRKVGDALFPMDEIRTSYEKKKSWWQDRLGPSRRTYRLWLQGPPRHTQADAEVLLGQYSKQIQDQQSFQAAAKRFSEDISSKNLAGDLGYLHRVQARYPEALTKAVFELPVGAFSPKIVAESGGFSLLMVSQEQPGPQGEDLWKAIRRYEMTALLAKLIEEKKLIYHDGK